jgi:hypothetical protein
MKTLSKVVGGLFAILVAAPAYAGYSIGTSTGPFALLTNWMQTFVDFMDGPAGIAVVVISLVAGVATWIWAPKSGAVGLILRIIMGAIVIMNIGTWMVSF